MGLRAQSRGGWDIATEGIRGKATRSDSRSTDPVTQRALPQARDGRLDGLAQRWLAAFPSSSRPTALCDNFPRLANRLALCWADPQLTGQVLNDLLLDKRGGRQGFPRAVRDELLMLRDRSQVHRQQAASRRPLAVESK